MAALGIAADVAELAATDDATHNDDLVDAWEKRECGAECMTSRTVVIRHYLDVSPICSAATSLSTRRRQDQHKAVH